MTLSKRPATIAIIFLTVWTGVLLAGADHPPPMGFLRLIPILIGCAILVYLRVPTYTDWSENRESGRIIKVAAEGLLGGMIVGLLVILLSATGEPNVLLTHGAEYGIWLTVLGTMGAVNALLVYVCSSVSRHDP